MSDEVNEGTNSQQTSTDPEHIVGMVIAGYKVVQRIGKSMVYLAFKDNPDNQVAIKIFYPDPYACNHDEILTRLQAITWVVHENVVHVFEVGEQDDFIYAIMEYVPGENLYDLMQRNPRLHWAAAAELAKEIMRGLVAAHDHNVTHRSLHPDRVLLGKGGQIKINFCNEGEITPSSEIAHYVSPEIFLGQMLDQSSDIYSLGTIIYNIVTGKPPLSGKSPKEIALKHREMAPVLPSYGVADIPHPLSLIISRSLSKHQKERYRTSFEVQCAINNFLTNDKGSYKLGSYKELLPKVVEVSQSGRAFTQAMKEERDRRKRYQTKETDIETETSELLEIQAPPPLPKEDKKSRYASLSSLQKKVIIASIASFLINLIVMILALIV